MTSLQDTTRTRLHRLALDRQRQGRVPGVSAGVSRHGRLLWHQGVGALDLDRPDHAPGPDDQYLVASNTKTFTAVLVMQLRDAGRLDLDDRLDQHLPGTRHDAVTIRQMLAHSSGMQREPVGDVWATLEQPDRDELVRGFEQAERVLKPHDRWHYSNLCYSLLGEVVARLEGASWAEVLQRRILDPLEMRRTTVGFSGSHSGTYFVPPWTDVPKREPFMPLHAMDPCAGLASTPTDLATWQGFVASPVEEVLSPDTMEEMCQPQIAVDPRGLGAAMGLGFFLIRHGSRMYVGHTGGMPGQITGVFTHRESGTGGIALTNTTNSPDPEAFAIDLADLVVEHDPELPEPWRPGTEVPDDLAPLVGQWFSEGQPYVFSVRQGRLEARHAASSPDAPPAVFEKIDEDVFRTVSGRERGERLRVERDDAGRVRHLYWATYLVSREPYAFGEHRQD